MLSLRNKSSLLHDGVYSGEKVASVPDLSSRCSQLTAGGRVGGVPSPPLPRGMSHDTAPHMVRHGGPRHPPLGPTAGPLISTRDARAPRAQRVRRQKKNHGAGAASREGDLGMRGSRGNGLGSTGGARAQRRSGPQEERARSAARVYD